MPATLTPEDVNEFWFNKDPKLWFTKDENFDNEIRFKFESLLTYASNGELSDWLDTPEGAVALIIVCDQFPRNIYRNSAKSFAFDSKAWAFAKEAIKRGHDKKFEASGDIHKLSFLYMPFMHSENKDDHEEALKLFNKPGLERKYKIELAHKEIIDKFGRYCHRNKTLGRKSSMEEIEFMKHHPGF